MITITRSGNSPNLTNKKWLIYGPPKTGKSSAASTFPNPLFLDFERRLDGLDVDRVEINSWEDAQEAYAMLRNTKTRGDFQTVVIDTADEAFAVCRRQVLREHNVKDESENNFLYPVLIRKRFEDFIRGVCELPLNIVITCHSALVTYSPKGGTQFNKMELALHDKVSSLITARVDVIAYTMVETVASRDVDKPPTQRFVLCTKHSPEYMAALAIGKGASLPDRCKPDYDWMVEHLEVKGTTASTATTSTTTEPKGGK